MNSEQLTWALDLLEEAAQFRIEKDMYNMELAVYFCKLNAEWKKQLEESYGR